jgi:PST family polysaccharide transporter
MIEQTSSSAPAEGDRPSDAGAAVRRKTKGHKGYGKTAKQGAVWSLTRQAGHELIAIPASMITARLLTPDDFGVAFAASFFVMLASRLTQFGFSASLVRIKEVRPDHLSSVFAFNLTTGVLWYLLLALSAPWLGGALGSAEAGNLIPVAALSFLVTPFGGVPAALVQRRMDFRNLALADWTDMLVGSIATIVLAWRGWGYWSIPTGHVISVAARVVLLMYVSRWRPSLRFSRSALGELMSFGLGVQTKYVLRYATANVDSIIVGRVLGMNALGLYDKAFATMGRMVNRLTLGQAPFRIFSIIQEDRERFARAYQRLVLGVTLLSYPAFAAAITVAEPLFVVLYGEKWVAAVVPFQLLCVSGMLQVLTGYAAQANEAAGGIWAQVRRQAVGSVLVVAGAAVGSRLGGIAGAAFGVTVARLVYTMSMQDLIRRVTGLTWGGMLSPQVPGITCAAAMAAVLVATSVAVNAAIPQPPALVLLLIQVAVGGLFYGVFVLFSPSAAVRELVDETADDLIPPEGLQLLNRVVKVGRASTNA